MPVRHSLVHNCNIRSNRVDKKAFVPKNSAFGQLAELR